MAEITADTESVRKQLDQLDDKLMTLLAQRMVISTEMAERKKGSGMPLFDPPREREILEKIVSHLDDLQGNLKEQVHSACMEVYEEIFTQSRRIQARALLPNVIYLIGYMGSGKTTVGTALSKLTGFQLVDIDHEIELEERLSIREIFNQKGEPYFRAKEEAFLEKLSGGKELIVSCGGGIVLGKKNRDLLSGSKAAVYLDGYPEAMFNRIKEDPNRPNAYFETVNEEQRREQFKKQYDKRKKYYTEAAKCTIFVDEETPEQLARGISYLLLETE